MADSTTAPTAEDRSRYETLRRELTQALPKKRAIDDRLSDIETHIYNLEGSYLTETAAHSGGNIIQGFENYLKNQTAGRRKNEIHDQDRIFSNSSLTTLKSLELKAAREESTATNDEYVKQPTPGVTTVVLPPATRNQELTVAQQKRIRDKEYQRRKRASVNRSTGDSEEDIVSTASVSSRRPTKRARLAADDD